MEIPKTDVWGKKGRLPFFLVSWGEQSSQWRSPNPVTDQTNMKKISKWKAFILL